MKRFTASAALALTLSLGLTDRTDASALLLDGVDDWVELTNSVGVVPSGAAPFTIGAWINPTTVPPGAGGQMTFWGTQGPANTANGWRLRGPDGTRHYFWGNDHDEGLGGDITPDTTGPNGDGWHHLAVTWDGNQTTQYGNGAPLGAPRVAAGVNVADANHRIGSRLGAEFFHGLIDEVTIWGAPLSATDIAGGWNLPIDYNDPGVQQALIAHYDFENGFGDRSALGGLQDGTAMGGAAVDPGANAPLVPEPTTMLLGILGTLFLLRRRLR